MSLRKKRIVLGLSLLFAAGSVAAAGESEKPEPATVRPGDPSLDASRLRPFTARYAMKRGGEDWATAIIDLRVAAVQAAPALRHSFSLHFKGQTVYDETLFLRKTLAPLMKFIHGGLPPDLAYKIYTFGEKAITGSNNFADGREPEKLSLELDGPVFGAGMDYLVLASLPLAEGYTARVAVGDDTQQLLNEVRVEGRERLTAAGQVFDTWVLSVQGGMGKRWIALDPPYLIRQEFPGAGIGWELAELPRREAYLEE